MIVARNEKGELVHSQVRADAPSFAMYVYGTNHPDHTIVKVL